MPELFTAIYAAVKDSDLKRALRLQRIGTEIILECIKYDYLALMRNMIAWQGVDAGYSRRPFRNYADAELTDLKNKLIAIRDKYQVTEEEVCFYAGLK
jgi:N-acetylneuraminate lyase